MPGQQAGTVTAPRPVTVSGGAGQSVNAGSFSYSNVINSTQRIGRVIISASDPAALASLTVTTSGSQESASVSPVAASNVFVFNPPIVVNPGASVTFTITARTAGGVAAIARRFAYAAFVELGGDHHDGVPLAPLGAGMLLIGLMLLPLAKPTRRRVALIVIGGLILTVALAGCGSSNSSNPSGYTATVFGSGALSNQVPLSTVTASSASGSVVSLQQLTGFGFE